MKIYRSIVLNRYLIKLNPIATYSNYGCRHSLLPHKHFTSTRPRASNMKNKSRIVKITLDRLTMIATVKI